MSESRTDVELLSEQLEGINSLLRGLVDKDPLAPLFPIWKRPGWTTPAEFAFMRGALEGIEGQVRALERSIQNAVESAELVEARG